MKTIVLISCVSRKGKTKTMAKELYKGALFKNSLEYGYALNPDHIFILSAKHHLLELDRVIKPYDVTLSYVSPAKKAKKPNLKVLTKVESINWGKEVVRQLNILTDINNDEFIFLAGQSYLVPTSQNLKNFKVPLKGLNQGKRTKKLKELIKEVNERRITQNI